MRISIRSLMNMAAALTFAGVAGAQQPVVVDSDAYQPADPSKFYKAEGYSPYAGRHYPERPLFGDQHVHTSWSGDAGMGGTTLDPEQALRFARGEEVVSTSGQPARLSRPLDWLAVTDHSDGMGTIALIREGDPEMMADPTLKRWHDMMAKGGADAQAAMMELIAAQTKRQLPKLIMDPRFAKSTWERNNAIAEKYNEPGRFTAMIGFEWTSNAGGGDNLHRNVIYRDGKARADQVLPLTTFVSENPEDLWSWMASWEAKTGGRMLAIPHNGNLSNGRMFELQTFKGGPLTREWAVQRARYERLFEAIQYKGQSESHPSMSVNDEFAAGYELWDRGNLTLSPKQPGMIAHEYLRDALKNGLLLEQTLGANPFKYGMAAGTDTHNALVAAEEDSFFGKFASSEPSPGRAAENAMKFGDRVVKGWELTAAGYMAVWATENTREAIWDAMERRETYATSGTRLWLRFFGGYDFDKADLQTRAPAIAGYRKGVPMGGDLPEAAAGKAPTFMVAAARDPYGGNLDRIQVIKGWVDAAGKTHEKIYDVAWSHPHQRRHDIKGRLTPVGNTVDVATASWTNTIGEPELMAVWKDPDFDPAVRAFYYARVLEIPTPRWTAYDAARFKVKMDPAVPMITQERAWSSPIWYTP
jgi:Protein of unknown function (DUF3604)